MSDGNGPYADRRLRLIDELCAENVAGPRVLEAMARVPRHLFVPERLVERAYENRALKIGDGQTISQPLVVALMTESLGLTESDKVLEVGTGSGYQAAVLSELASEVHTVERSEWLHTRAREPAS